MNSLGFDFLRFGWKDAIDVLIVSVIFYQLLRLTKGTRSAQIIIGMVFIGAIAFFSYWFQLEALTWLFSNLATVGFIVLVIVFQPELRGALAHMGQNPLFRRLVKFEHKRTLEDVSRAALRLAELRYGGLIVIERRTGLRNFAESGRLMNAELSSELLITLFTPYTPLHDGAAIVSNNYVVAAAASLPLTTNPKYAKMFGMRHKAAVGVSEVSDAVVVVISEENQAVSIAFEGELERDIKKSEFRERLAWYLKQA